MITCDQYDRIEIVCTFKYPIKLTMKSGTVIDCIPIDTKRNKNGDECVKVEINGIERLLVLDDISTLEVSVDNPHFKIVTFS